MFPKSGLDLSNCVVIVLFWRAAWWGMVPGAWRRPFLSRLNLRSIEATARWSYCTPLLLLQLFPPSPLRISMPTSQHRLKCWKVNELNWNLLIYVLITLQKMAMWPRVVQKRLNNCLRSIVTEWIISPGSPRASEDLFGFGV